MSAVKGRRATRASYLSDLERGMQLQMHDIIAGGMREGRDPEGGRHKELMAVQCQAEAEQRMLHSCRLVGRRSLVRDTHSLSKVPRLAPFWIRDPQRTK